MPAMWDGSNPDPTLRKRFCRLGSAETSSADHNAESGLADLLSNTLFAKPF